MGIFLEQICESAHHETTIEGVRLTNSSRPVWTDFPGENSNQGGELLELNEWGSGGWGGATWKAASIISILILMLSVLNKLTARFHI